MLENKSVMKEEITAKYLGMILAKYVELKL